MKKKIRQLAYLLTAIAFVLLLASCSRMKTVTIGNQTWMAENLNVTHYINGHPIPKVTDSNAWDSLITGAYCYFKNDNTYGSTYGGLYNWYAVNTGKLCPRGWHVPSNLEWTTLCKYLGDDSITGGKLKEEGTSHWESPNTGASNISGFTALPGGYRNNNGKFSLIYRYGYWWSSTAENDNGAWYRNIYYDKGKIYDAFVNKNKGFSVRCVKNK